MIITKMRWYVAGMVLIIAHVVAVTAFMVHSIMSGDLTWIMAIALTPNIVLMSRDIFHALEQDLSKRSE